MCRVKRFSLIGNLMAYIVIFAIFAYFQITGVFGFVEAVYYDFEFG